MYGLLKNVLFTLDPEVAHDLTLHQFSKNPYYLRKLFKGIDPAKMIEVKTHNMTWRNRLGLAAGFDKNGIALDFLNHLGFGAIEIGTVTLKEQIGNDRPRMWRHSKELSLRNALGFPCKGASYVKKNTQTYNGEATLGINIGKNKDTSLNDCPGEYSQLVKIFEEDAGYLVINISSPNTKNLRKLQDQVFLKEILDEVNKQRSLGIPIYIKISPDEDWSDSDTFVRFLIDNNIQGLVCTNTTICKKLGTGGVSGNYLKNIARKTQKSFLKSSSDFPDFDIIAAGGINSREDINDLNSAGCNFFQLYTALVYKGPSILDLALKKG